MVVPGVAFMSFLLCHRKVPAPRESSYDPRHVLVLPADACGLSVPACGRLLPRGLGDSGGNHVLTAVDTSRLAKLGSGACANGRAGPTRRAPGAARAGSGVSVLRAGRRRARARSIARPVRRRIPSACRHFPREIVLDPRGTLRVALPLLPDGRSAAHHSIAPSTSSRRRRRCGSREPIDGLDAREALPPLVRPGLLSRSRMGMRRGSRRAWRYWRARS